MLILTMNRQQKEKEEIKHNLHQFNKILQLHTNIPLFIHIHFNLLILINITFQQKKILKINAIILEQMKKVLVYKINWGVNNK